MANLGNYCRGLMKSKSSYLSFRDGEIFLELLVTAKAGRNAIKGMHDARLRISVTAPPDKGKANKAIVDLMSKILSLPKNKLSIFQGLAHRKKTLLIKSSDYDSILRTLQDLIPDLKG